MICSGGVPAFPFVRMLSDALPPFANFLQHVSNLFRDVLSMVPTLSDAF